jgi:hypothetical protein
VEDTIGFLLSKNQQDVIFLFSIYFNNYSLHVSRRFTAHHQVYISVYTAIDLSHALCWPAASKIGVEHILIAVYTE